MKEKRGKDRKSKNREQGKETLPEARIQEDEATPAATGEEQPRNST